MFGFDLGNLQSSSTGASYVDSFFYSGGAVTKTYNKFAFAYATQAQAVILPAINIPASTVPQFPSVSASLSQGARAITVYASGGNISCRILVFVR